MTRFEHVRHRPAVQLDRPRELVIACPALRSGVNFSRIVRVAGCCGIKRIIAAGRPVADRQIARDACDEVQIERHRSLAPVLRKMRDQFRLVGLEQSTGSQNLAEYHFQRRTLLVIGHERDGLSQQLLDLMHDAVEIPVFGRPLSYNVATATALALYEYCRQFPRG